MQLTLNPNPTLPAPRQFLSLTLFKPSQGHRLTRACLNTPHCYTTTHLFSHPGVLPQAHTLKVIPQAQIYTPKMAISKI